MFKGEYNLRLFLSWLEVPAQKWAGDREPGGKKELLENVCWLRVIFISKRKSVYIYMYLVPVISRNNFKLNSGYSHIWVEFAKV